MGYSYHAEVLLYGSKFIYKFINERRRIFFFYPFIDVVETNDFPLSFKGASGTICQS